MRKRKVLHITQAFGGVQTYILNIVKFSDKNKFEHAVICPQSSLSREIEILGIRYFPVRIRRSPGYNDFFSLCHIVWVIFRYRPAVLHVHSAKGGALGRIAAKITFTKVVFTPNAFSYLGFTGKRRKLYFLVEKILRPFTSVFLAVSESEKERAIKELGFNREIVYTVPNSVFIDSKLQSTRNYELRNKIGMIGRLIFQKNPILFIEIAFAAHKVRPDLKFVILGEGYLDFQKTDVMDLIEKYKASDYIEILRWGEYNIDQFLDEIDVFLLTSRFEGLPFSILEAMKSGLPVIATRVDGNKDILDDHLNGFLIEENDIEGCVETISLLIDHKELREEIGSKARSKVDLCFNIEKNVPAIEKVYLTCEN